MRSHGGLGVPLISYLVIVLVLGPLVGLAGAWVWLVFSGLAHLTNLESVREIVMLWMTLLLGGAAVCLMAEWVLIPIVLARGGRRSRWLTAPLTLALGLAAGAAVFEVIDGGRTDLSPLLHGQAFHAAGSVAPLASVIAFSGVAALVAWACARRGRDGVTP